VVIVALRKQQPLLFPTEGEPALAILRDLLIIIVIILGLLQHIITTRKYKVY
jgi:hypothetical protein